MLKIKEIREAKKLTQDDVVKLTGIKKRSYVDYENEKSDVPFSKLQKIAIALGVDVTDLIEGEKSPKKENLIPFYDDVESIGGNNYVADMNGITQSTEYIDAGDWFPNVTAAIRHYNDSMLEYPSGCILALEKINEIQSIIWGCNYVIETSEFRITKRMQTADDDNYLMAYSTNNETYPDGKQIHEPKKILKSDINNIFLVLGRIVKEHSSGPVFTKNK